MRNEQRNLQNAVVIQYAKTAMGETARGLLIPLASNEVVRICLFTLACGHPELANECRLAPFPRHHQDLQAIHQRVLPRHAPLQHVEGPGPLLAAQGDLEEAMGRK